MQFEINGIKFQAYNEYPYGKADLSEENMDRFAEFSGLKTHEGIVAYKDTVMWNLLRYTWKYVGCNNWRKRHGLVKIKRKTRSKRECEICCCRI